MALLNTNQLHWKILSKEISLFSIISENRMHTNYPDTFLKWTHIKTRNTNVNYSGSTCELHINAFKVKHMKFRRRIKYIHDFDTFLLIIYSYLSYIYSCNEQQENEPPRWRSRLSIRLTRARLGVLIPAATSLSR